MIYRIYPTKDTFIANTVLGRVRYTGSNVGAAEALEVFKSPGVSGAIGTFGSASLSRILMKFELSSITAATGSGELDGSPRYFLRLHHKTHGESLPYSFDLFVHPISGAWDEGRGRDDIGLKDPGVCNWVRRTTAAAWVAPGGDFWAGPSGSVHFDTGEEDLEFDVTPIVNAWMTGGLVNDGLMVKLTGTVESDLDFSDVYTKRFYSRTSNYVDRRPYIEARYSDSLRDDRKNMSWGRTGSLFLYNFVGGQYTDLSIGTPYVRIRDSSGTLTTLTGSRVRTGIYSASFALATGSYSGSLFTDIWFSGSVSILTGTFMFGGPNPTFDADARDIVARVRNIRNEYRTEETVRMDVLFRTRDQTLPSVFTSSLSVPTLIAERAWYAVENDSTGLRVIPFDTGSDDATRMSYDGDGNFFRLRMANLHSGEIYRVLFLVEDRGVRQVIDPGAKFRVA